MKIQCACGAKYAFDATPEMLQNPVRFVCPSCGLDSSDYVNELVRREFAGQTPAVAAPPRRQPNLHDSKSPMPDRRRPRRRKQPRLRRRRRSIAPNISAKWPWIIAWFAESRCAANA